MNSKSQQPCYELHNIHEKIEEYEEEEECEDNLVKIQLQSSSFNVIYSQLFKYSKFIRDNYPNINDIRLELSKNLQIFQSDFKIKEENVILFFKLLQNESIIINNQNYCDLLLLSNFFQVKKITRILNQYKKTYFFDTSFIISQLLMQISKPNANYLLQDQASIEMESLLYNRINDCLQDGPFGLIPISVIYRIISKSDKSQISSDLLFDFISKSIEERFTLFTFLSIQNLSKTKFDELCQLSFPKSR